MSDWLIAFALWMVLSMILGAFVGAWIEAGQGGEEEEETWTGPAR